MLSRVYISVRSASVGSLKPLVAWVGLVKSLFFMTSLVAVHLLVVGALYLWTLDTSVWVTWGYLLVVVCLLEFPRSPIAMRMVNVTRVVKW